jgi:hypothetical protein
MRCTAALEPLALCFRSKLGGLINLGAIQNAKNRFVEGH